MSTSITKHAGTQVARPLYVLVPLIKEDLRQAQEAAEEATKPYYQSAGEKLREAQGQIPTKAEFYSWAHRHFGVKETQVKLYISYSKATENSVGGRPSSFSEALRDVGLRPRGAEYGGAAWREPIREVLRNVDTETLNLRRDALKRSEEREALRNLCLQIIDIGYKALATKLHPDKGGSREAMARLNQARDRLRQSA